MRFRFTPLVAAAALLFVNPQSARAQIDPSFKVSTTSPQATAEFNAGLRDYENLSSESAASHFDAASKADPSFGLARVLFAGTTTSLTAAQQNVELNRGVADAAHASTNELLLAAAYREGFLNHQKEAGTLFNAAAQLMPADKLLAFATAGGVSAAPLPGVRKFVTKYPDYAPAYNSLAYLLWTEGDKAGALAAAKRQVELNPNAPNPHDTYAEILQWNGNFPEATAHYKQAASMSPRFPEAYAGLAEVEALQGHYDQARSYLNQAIANAWTPQEKVGYMRQIAGTYALEGGPPAGLDKQLESIAAEAKAQQNARTVAVNYAQLAAAEAAAGNTAAAHQALAMAKSASPEVPWPVHYYGAVAHGYLKHWAPANEELNALKAMATSDPGSRDYAAAAEGFLATQQGRPADALKSLMAADTTNLLVMNRIAEAHAALGHSAEAAAWYNRINADRALSLADFPGVNSRRRARIATAKK
jgi:tetratricopeptide (TPR) repeat protein